MQVAEPRIRSVALSTMFGPLDREMDDNGVANTVRKLSRC